jgi:hypothetical protein
MAAASASHLAGGWAGGHGISGESHSGTCPSCPHTCLVTALSQMLTAHTAAAEYSAVSAQDHGNSGSARAGLCGRASLRLHVHALNLGTPDSAQPFLGTLVAINESLAFGHHLQQMQKPAEWRNESMIGYDSETKSLPSTSLGSTSLAKQMVPFAVAAPMRMILSHT